MAAPTEIPLLCHPARPCAAVGAVVASVALTDSGALALRYRLHGDPGGIRIPGPRPPAAADNLWQHTCCEAFIAAVDGPEYREFNFSPSGQWAAYRFASYRVRDEAFAPAGAPRIDFRQRADGFQLDALVAAELLPTAASLCIGLSAVIETADAELSYWALAHCAAQPDFHLRPSFTLTLSTAQS